MSPAVRLLSRRAMLGIAAVVDIAHHARPAPVAARALAARHQLPPRHLETLLQAFVRHGILKGVRGPRGGYELARERRRISAGDIVRAALTASLPGEEAGPASRLVEEVVGPAIEGAEAAFLTALDAVSVEDLCRAAEGAAVFPDLGEGLDFAI